MTDTAYVFEGAGRHSELDRLHLLESVFDPASRRVLLAAGLSAGMRCLEIGAGAGSIATWMGEVVGTKGWVAAVDISTRFLTETTRANVAVYEADIRTVDLEPASFDIAHARFVFIHVAEWRAALDAGLRLLKPGGRLVLEEPDFSVSQALAGEVALRHSFHRVHEAIEAMFNVRNMDHAFGLRLPAVLEELRLDNVTFENDVPIAQGGSPLARMMGMSTRQLREKYLATGLATDADIENYGAFSSHPSSWAIYHGTVRGSARKPGSGARQSKASSR